MRESIAHHPIMTSCSESIAGGNYTLLVSLNIQETENVEWRDIMIQLQSLNIPVNISGVISFYLSQRTALINWGAGASSH